MAYSSRSIFIYRFHRYKLMVNSWMVDYLFQCLMTPYFEGGHLKENIIILISICVQVKWNQLFFRSYTINLEHNIRSTYQHYRCYILQPKPTNHKNVE